MTALRVEVIESWPGVWALREEWTDLLRSSSAGTTFLDFPWLRSWSEVYGDEGSPWVVMCRDESGMLVGAAPLFLTRIGTPVALARALCFIGHIGADSDRLDVIAVQGREQEVVGAVMDAIASASGAWDILELGHMPGDSSSLAPLRRAFADKGWIVEERRSMNVIVDLPDTWDQFVERLSAKARRMLRYRPRYMHRAGFTVRRRCKRVEELPQFLDALFGMHNERWQQRGVRGHFHDTRRRAFHLRVGSELLERGELWFDLLEFKGTPVAAHFSFTYGTTYYLLATGFNPAYARYSPGLVLTGEVIEELISKGFRHYDFQEGDEEYKLRWASRAAEYAHMRVARPGTAGAMYLKLAAGAMHVRLSARSRIPRVWHAIRLLRQRLARD